MVATDAKGFVACAFGGERFALPVAAVERVLPAAAISPLPGAPRAIVGMLNLRGQPVAVLDLRQCLGLPPKLLQLDDHLVLVRSGSGRFAFFVDGVEGVVPQPDDAMSLAGNLEHWLDPAESAQLERSLE